MAACNDGDIPPGFTNLLILHEGQVLRAGPCRPEAWSEVSSWRLLFACPAAAQEAARTIGHIAVSCACLDDDSLLCELAPNRGPVDETVTALVKAGIPVAGCRYEPPWPAQLLDAVAPVND